MKAYVVVEIKVFPLSSQRGAIETYHELIQIYAYNFPMMVYNNHLG
jgi:hypothetical protein